MIIKSLLDTDLYKINMLRVYFHRFSNRIGKFTFKCRNKDVVFTPSMLKRINEEIDSLCSLKFKEEEIQYIGNLSWMKKSIGFLEFLRLFQFNRNYIDVQLNQNQLKIEAKGPIFMVSYFETFVLSIVSEVYYNAMYPEMDYDLAKSRLNNKIELLKVVR
jgi:nicotinate phosphoribosyltransferase